MGLGRIARAPMVHRFGNHKHGTPRPTPRGQRALRVTAPHGRPPMSGTCTGQHVTPSHATDVKNLIGSTAQQIVLVSIGDLPSPPPLPRRRRLPTPEEPASSRGALQQAQRLANGRPAKPCEGFRSVVFRRAGRGGFFFLFLNSRKIIHHSRSLAREGLVREGPVHNNKSPTIEMPCFFVKNITLQSLEPRFLFLYYFPCFAFSPPLRVTEEHHGGETTDLTAQH